MRVALLSLLLLPAIMRAADVEPWSDKDLPVRDGLALWVTPLRQPAALKDGDPVSVLRDASGHFVDESYWNLTGDPSRIHVLADALEDGQPRPLMWTYEHGKGRVFVSVLGHYAWTFDDPLFRVLVLRGIGWCAGAGGDNQTDRLIPLATIGARLR
jgi:hypothetical protein